MTFPKLRENLLRPILFLLMLTTAFFTPWWGTLVVVGAIRLFSPILLRTVAVHSFQAWAIACLIRDVAASFGPSRIFAKLFKFEILGLSSDSIVARLLIYIVMGIVGMVLAVMVAGLIKSLQELRRSFKKSVAS